ncbi:MAG TPA: 6-phosphogluconolactonase [Solirubrobacteraceae bacterium]|jgi:6-phosphogluconolactonase|nr:6-phosphogluconolactonase [Solirubrobacteraceae bacterium]
MTEAQQIEVLPDAAALAARAAEVVVEHARLAIADRGAFTLAISGGHTPMAMFSEMAREDFPWDQTTIYQVDERVAPAGDEDRNLTHQQESLSALAAARLRPMPVEEIDLDAAAERYARSLPERFDLIHLGLGPDGHTASLVPNDPVLEVVERSVALTQPYMGYRRMTFTYPVLDRARALLWLVAGSDKRDALGDLRRQDRSIPAGRVSSANALILADVEVAGQGADVSRRPMP